jgi:hypothetical protein
MSQVTLVDTELAYYSQQFPGHTQLVALCTQNGFQTANEEDTFSTKERKQIIVGNVCVEARQTSMYVVMESFFCQKDKQNHACTECRVVNQDTLRMYTRAFLHKHTKQRRSTCYLQELPSPPCQVSVSQVQVGLLILVQHKLSLRKIPPTALK